MFCYALYLQVAGFCHHWGFWVCKEILSVCFLTRSQCSPCHAGAHSPAEWGKGKPMKKKSPFPPAAFWARLNQSGKTGSSTWPCLCARTTNHEGSSTPDALWSVCWLSIGWCGPLHRCRGFGPFFPAASQSDSAPHWQTFGMAEFGCLHFFGHVHAFTTVLACVCASQELNYSIPTMLCCLISRPLLFCSWLHVDSTIGTVLPHQEAKGPCNKRRQRKKNMFMD